jgi:PAS domain-containing protein
VKRKVRQPATEHLCPNADKPPESSGPEAGDRGEPQGADPDLGLRVSDILEALPFYVLLLDEQHQILQANSAVREQLGFTPEAIVGKYLRGTFIPIHAALR